MSATTVNDEVKIRISTEDKELPVQAAAATSRSLSELVRSFALQGAREVLAEVRLRSVTMVPAASYERLMFSLEESDVPIAKLADAARSLATLDLDALLA